MLPNSGHGSPEVVGRRGRIDTAQIQEKPPSRLPDLDVMLYTLADLVGGHHRHYVCPDSHGQRDVVLLSERLA